VPGYQLIPSEALSITETPGGRVGHKERLFGQLRTSSVSGRALASHATSKMGE